MTRRRGEVVDALVVVALTATVLSVLDDSFSGRSYLVAGLVPAVLLLAAAAVGTRVREGGWWYAIVTLVVFAPLGALVALRRPGPYLVPTLETMGRVLGESFSAHATLVSTVPPVDARGQVMLVPFLIGFLATAPAAWLALGTRSALAPAVPLVVALAVTIPLGVMVPGLLIVRGILFAIVVVGWAAARARRRESLVGERRGAVAAAVTAVLTVTLVSAVVSLLVPDRNEVDRVLLRGDGSTAAVAGASDSVVPRRVGRRNELLRATGVPEGRRVRFAALDLYDGSAWVPAQESPGAGGTGTFKRIGHDVAPLHAGRTVGVRIQIRPGYSGDWLPTVGELASLDLDSTDGRTQLSDVRYNQATGSALVVGGVDPRDDYTFASVLTPEAFTRDDPTREPAEEQLQPQGAFLDRYLDPFDRQELRPVERVLLLARYLRINGTTRFTGSSSQAPVDLGLRMLGGEEPVGSPFQYTAVMALGASRLGVPARVVTGAEPRPNGIVQHDDVTSWVELQFADGTWRPLDQQRYVGVHLVSEQRGAGSGTSVRDFVTEQLERAARGRDPEIRLPKGTPVALPPGTPVRDDMAPWEVALRIALVLVAAATLALLLVPPAKLLRRHARRRASSWSAAYVAAWQEVLDTSRDLGRPVPEAWGRARQAAAIGTGLDLARRVDAAVFAAEPPADEDVGGVWHDAQLLRRRLVSEAGTRARVWSSFSPASLLAGWQRRRTTVRTASALGQVGDEHGGSGRQHPARA